MGCSMRVDPSINSTSQSLVDTIRRPARPKSRHPAHRLRRRAAVELAVQGARAAEERACLVGDRAARTQRARFAAAMAAAGARIRDQRYAPPLPAPHRVRNATVLTRSKPSPPDSKWPAEPPSGS